VNEEVKQEEVKAEDETLKKDESPSEAATETTVDTEVAAEETP